MDRKFPLGQVVSTPSALDAMRRSGQDAWKFLGQHATGDWSELDEEDRQENKLSLQKGIPNFIGYHHSLFSGGFSYCCLQLKN